MRILLIIPILCFILIACNKHKTKQETINYLEIDKSENIVAISASFEENYNSLLNPKNIYQPPFKDYFYSFDKENQALYKYEFGKDNFEKITNFDIDNNSYLISFNIDSKERYISFIIEDINADAYVLEVYSLDGNIILEKKIPQHSQYVLGAFFPHILTDTFKLFTHCMRIDGGYPYSPKFPTYSIEMEWDIKNDILEILPITYPKNYINKYFGYSYSIDRIAINDSIHAFSFTFNDSIYLYNINTQKTTVYNAGTNKIKEIPNVHINELAAYHQEIKEDIALNCPSYFQMSYLPQQGLYIRYFKNHKKETSQIIYDKDFNYIGELTENLKFFFDGKDNFKHLGLRKGILYLEQYNLKIKNQEIAHYTNEVKYNKEKYLKDNFDAGVQKFLEKTKLIPQKNDSIIIYQSTHCSACVKDKALTFLQEKDNKNTTIIVFDQSDKEMLANHIFLSPIVLCKDNSLSEEGYYHHMPHLYFWKGNKVTSSPIVKEKEEENI